jgi:hypothetical protein
MGHISEGEVQQRLGEPTDAEELGRVKVGPKGLSAKAGVILVHIQFFCSSPQLFLIRVTWMAFRACTTSLLSYLSSWLQDWLLLFLHCWILRKVLYTIPRQTLTLI